MSPNLKKKAENVHFYLTERQKEILAGLLVTLSVFAGFMAGEVAIRGVHLWKFGFDESVEKSSKFFDDPRITMPIPRPGTVHGGVTINALGFRSPPIEVPKPEGVVRIAFLGSSTTYDAYADGDDNWPATLTRGLQAETSCRLDYLNAGSPGFSTNHMQDHFDANVVDTKPDIVVILPSDFNSDADTYVIDHGLHDGVHYRPSWLAEVSKLWEELETNAVIISRQRSAHSLAGKVEVDLDAMTARFKGRLENLVDRVIASGAMPVVLGINSQIRREQTPEEQGKAAVTALFYMPYLSIPQLLDIKDKYNSIIERIAADRNIPFIPSSSIDIPGTGEYYVDTNHYGTAGSILAGKNLTSAFADREEIIAKLNSCLN